ncbi:hypothetical protein MFLAVUS_006055 [Mucor flavus]|uniref:Uncharacterized protein n=1 Tax=Mucor flavus TaxID=439312 RepID=A0ABP9Z0H6_9FUNG
MKLVTLSSLLFVPLALCAAVPRPGQMEDTIQKSPFTLQEQQDLVNTFLIRKGLPEFTQDAQLLTNQVIQEQSKYLETEEGPTEFTIVLENILRKEAINRAQGVASDNFFADLLAGLFNLAGGLVNDVGNTIEGAIQGTAGAIGGAVQGLVTAPDPITGIINGAAGAINGAFDGIQQGVSGGGKQTGPISDLINTADNIAKGIAGTVTGGIVGTKPGGLFGIQAMEPEEATPGEVISGFLRAIMGPNAVSPNAFGDLFAPPKPANTTSGSSSTGGGLFGFGSGSPAGLNTTSGGSSGSSSGGLGGLFGGGDSKKNSTSNGGLLGGLTGGLSDLTSGLTGALTGGSKTNNTNSNSNSNSSSNSNSNSNSNPLGDLLGGVTGGLTGALTGGSKSNNTNSNSNSNPLGNLLGGVTGGLTGGSKSNNTNSNPLGDLLGGLTGGLTGGSKSNNTNSNPLGDLLGGLTGGLTGGSKSNSTNPLGDLLGGITGGLTGGSKTNGSNPLGDLLGGLTGGLTGGSKSNSTNPLGDLLGGITGGLTGGSKTNGSNPLGDLLGGITGGLTGGLSGNGSNPLGGLLGGLTGGLTGGANPLGGLLGLDGKGGLGGLLGGIADSAGGLLGNIVNPDLLNGGLALLGKIVGGVSNGTLDIPNAIGQIIDFVAKSTGSSNPLSQFISNVSSFLSQNQDGLISSIVKFGGFFVIVFGTVANLIISSITNAGDNLLKGILDLVFNFFGKMMGGGLFHRLQSVSASDMLAYQTVFLDAVRSESPDAAMQVQAMFNAAHMMVQKILMTNPNVLRFLAEPTQENIDGAVAVVSQIINESF